MEAKAKSHAKKTLSEGSLPVIVFSLFFSWLLSFSFDGQVLHAITSCYEVSAQPYAFGAMASHFAGLATCSLYVTSIKKAKSLILASIAFCIAASCVFFSAPSFLWKAALLSASFLVGACVAAWGFYFKNCFSNEDRAGAIASCLIFSNALMVLINLAAMHLSAQAGLGSSIFALFAAFAFALKLPKASQAPIDLEAAGPQGEGRASLAGPLAFICLFIFAATISSGLMYQIVNPEFAHLKILASWYWVVPYIGAMLIMRRRPGSSKRAYSLYISIAMTGFSFILFLLLGRGWQDYLVINTLMLGACGIHDLFWWSILGQMLEFGSNPAFVMGAGLGANVMGVLIGGIAGSEFAKSSSGTHNSTLLALSVVCAMQLMLPALSSQLSKLLESQAYTAPGSKAGPKQKQQATALGIAEQLTVSENKVMLLLIQGKPYKAIASELSVSENTIRTHVKSIYAKAGVSSKAELSYLVLSQQQAAGQK
ncbi:MAG: helix-turn-helix transcriptional regulator [Eubacteriaceae bacterium]|nr:helix-turn-helix transcriptional regulator [Eubacteriaceae bacterium]